MAAPRVRVKFSGGKQLQRGLEGMGEEMATKVGYRANLKAAQYLRDKYVEAAPYSGDDKSTTKSWTLKGKKGKRRILAGQTRSADYGHLRDNIRLRRDKARKQGYIVHLVTVGRAFWGRFLEYGTKKMAARPWMRPAFEANKEAVADIQREELDRLIKRTAKKIPGAKAKWCWLVQFISGWPDMRLWRCWSARKSIPLALLTRPLCRTSRTWTWPRSIRRGIWAG